MRGEWKAVVTEYGKFDINGEPMFGYETRPATESEIEIANKPIDRNVESAFWNEFSITPTGNHRQPSPVPDWPVNLAKPVCKPGGRRRATDDIGRNKHTDTGR